VAKDGVGIHSWRKSDDSAIQSRDMSGNSIEYLVIVEQGDTSFGAYVPDLPGCVAVGETRDEAIDLIREAIEMHIESLRENGEPVPLPHSFVEKIAV
jgi:predicted RNase H-like HicB family nuclease